MKPNKFANLFIAIIFGFSATLNASIPTNSQILQSNLNSLSIPQTNKSIKGTKFNSNSNEVINKASNLNISANLAFGGHSEQSEESQNLNTNLNNKTNLWKSDGL